MATIETQTRITNKAIELFNEHGTKAISTNRIADECEVSRGNLYYHFRTKEEIIKTIFQQINKEIEESWYDDHRYPTMERMHLMFSRQMRLIWNYRFFYRELAALLQKDERLKILFMAMRRKRVKEVAWFFSEMVKAGFIELPAHSNKLDSLLLVTWLISDHWVPYLDMNDMNFNKNNIQKGFDLIFQILDPYFTEKAKKEHERLIQRKNTNSC